MIVAFRVKSLTPELGLSPWQILWPLALSVVTGLLALAIFPVMVHGGGWRSG